MSFQALHHRFIDWTKPDTATSLLLGTLTDLARSKSELVAENALLRQQLIILHRQVKQPASTKTDRMILGLLTKGVRTRKQDLFIFRADGAPPLVWSEHDAIAVLPLRNCCCTEVIIKKPQEACSLT